MSDCDHMCTKCDGEPCIEFRPKMAVPRELQTDYEMMVTANLLMAASIESIKRKDEQLKTENAKLAEQYEAVIADYRSEVAKLCELANCYEALTATLCNERECDGCPFDGTEQIVCEHMRLQTCLSELGIEVTA